MPRDVLPHVLVLPRQRHAVEQRVPRRLSYVAFSVEELDQEGEDEEGGAAVAVAAVGLVRALLGAVVVVAVGLQLGGL